MGVGEFLQTQLKESTLKVLDVTGHCAHMSHPALVIEAMQAYLAAQPAHP
jgi:sigma-B regulation protein RsbQ